MVPGPRTKVPRGGPGPEDPGKVGKPYWVVSTAIRVTDLPSSFAYPAGAALSQSPGSLPVMMG